MVHFFLDESRSNGPTAVLALVTIDETNRQELLKILALPDKSKFTEDAYRLLYQIEDNDLKNPEYAFRRVQRAYFSKFSFSNVIQSKVCDVLQQISALDFKVHLLIYCPSDAVKMGLTQSDLKSKYTQFLLAEYVAENQFELTRDSIVEADNGFYSSKKLRLVRTSFRGRKAGILLEDSPELKYPHDVNKAIDICASYDSKGIQLADLLAGIAARTIYKPKDSDFFYLPIAGKIVKLFDKQNDKPYIPGSIRHPLRVSPGMKEVYYKPDLRTIRKIA